MKEAVQEIHESVINGQMKQAVRQFNEAAEKYNTDDILRALENEMSMDDYSRLLRAIVRNR